MDGVLWAIERVVVVKVVELDVLWEMLLVVVALVDAEAVD